MMNRSVFVLESIEVSFVHLISMKAFFVISEKLLKNIIFVIVYLFLVIGDIKSTSLVSHWSYPMIQIFSEWQTVYNSKLFLGSQS